MKQKHSPGPLQVRGGQVIEDAEGHEIAKCWLSSGKHLLPTADNAYALVACFNACNGDAEVVKELLEALKELVSHFEAEIHNEYSGTSKLESRLSECDYARAAIARAEGKQ